MAQGSVAKLAFHNILLSLKEHPLCCCPPHPVGKPFFWEESWEETQIQLRSGTGTSPMVHLPPSTLVATRVTPVVGVSEGQECSCYWSFGDRLSGLMMQEQCPLVRTRPYG